MSQYISYSSRGGGGGGGGGTVTSVDMSVPTFLAVAGNPITTSGTLALTLSGTALPQVNGGTGFTTYATGDILYASAPNVLSKLTAGSDGQVLKLASGVPSWSSGSVSGAFNASSSNLNNLTVNNSVGTLTLNISTPISGDRFLFAIGADSNVQNKYFQANNASNYWQMISNAAPLTGGGQMSFYSLGLVPAIQRVDFVTPGVNDLASCALKNPGCRAVSTSNISLTGDPGTVNGVGSWVTGDRLLVSGQTSAPANGVYRVKTTGAWVRVADLVVPADFYAGQSFQVLEGTYAGTTWTLTTQGTIVVGTTALTFTQVGGGSGANTSLSNLSNPTAINADFVWSPGNIANIKTDDDSTQTTQDVNVSTGHGSSSGNGSGAINLTTGDSDSAGVGSINLTLGTPDGPGNKGSINFIDASEGTVGDVWQSYDTGGQGTWAHPSLTGFQGSNNVYVDAANYPTIQDAITYAETLGASDSSPGVCVVVPAGQFAENVLIKKNVSLMGSGMSTSRIDSVTIRPTSDSVQPDTICISNISINNATDNGTFTVTNETAPASGVFNLSMLGQPADSLPGLTLNNVALGVTSITNISNLNLINVYCNAATFALSNINDVEITGGFIDSTVTIAGNNAATGAFGDMIVFADVACIIGSLAVSKGGGSGTPTLTCVNCELTTVDIGAGTQVSVSGGSTNGYTTGTPLTWNCTAPYTPLTSTDWATQPTNVDSALDKLARIPSARYFASSTTISGTLATISWTTKDYDTDSAMSSGTYTVPVAGKYQVNAGLLVSGTIALNNTLIMEIQKNGTVVSRTKEFLPGTITDGTVSISDIINCAATDTLRIQVSCSATSPAIVASNFDNFISLCKVG